MQQPPLPSMEPIKPTAQPQAAPPPPAPAHSAPARPMGARFRQIVAYVGGASLGFVMLVGAGELVLKPGLRPSDLVATVESHVELGVMNQKLGHVPGEHVLTEADYQRTIAEAQRQGAAKAELEFQKELVVVQADKERVVSAYGFLYQRAEKIAEAGLQMESVAQQFRQQLLAMSNGGRSVVIMFKDFACGLGDQEACASARKDREVMIGESDELSRGDVGAKIRALIADVPDPATLVVREDQRRHGTPSLPAR